MLIASNINRRTCLLPPASRQMITMAQTSICCHIIAMVMYFSAFIFLMIAGGLFIGAYVRYNNELNELGHTNRIICILYLKENFTPHNNFICIFPIVCEALAVLSLLISSGILSNSFVKLVRKKTGWVCTKRINNFSD